MTSIDKNKSIDKVAVARKVAEDRPDYSVLDLDEQTAMLIRRIKDANCDLIREKTARDCSERTHESTP